MEWPESVQRVARTLQAARIETHIEELAGPRSADAVGADELQLVDVQLFTGGGRTIVALVPGGSRVDPDRLAALAGIAVEPGGFSDTPFPPSETALVLADRALLAHDRVWVAAGSPRHLASVTPSDLIRITRARTVALVGGG
jgi:prolyl-tRNA editing enzyme YbaK/EbsC (Cys-tRNA(Pro) deacylase)